ncbi:MAG: M28 family peptidase [Sporocytophaga sp.]|uniref:M28 family peptidase n=1 Tax=Sporocytophaga sp. TaxID=2231183 RepID=UPI001B1D8DEC|nr:M28 family peptidase [Sporocytophaga sp.]MBO9701721.1 M28 family peptidase [Sporocytophaga sp.]
MKTLLLLGSIFFLIGTLFYFLTTPLFGSAKPGIVSIPVSSERLKNDVKILCTTSKPRNYKNIDALNEAADYIFNEFKKNGLNPQEQKYIADDNEYKNIISTYGPSDAARIIIGAHYDVCMDYAGADDNASGVAGLLEIGRLLDSLKPTLKYRVDLVAYTLEEPPYFRTSNMGSAIHSKYIIENNIPFKAMVCLEMIGYFSDESKSQDYPVGVLKAIYPTRGNFIAVVGRIGENNLVKQIKKSMIEGSSINVESINAPKAMVGIDFSDHLNYWKNDLPAVMITNTSFYRNKNYHESTDTPETLNYVKMAEVVKGVYWAIVNIK